MKVHVTKSVLVLSAVVAAVFVAVGVRAGEINPGDYANTALIRFDGYTGASTLTNFPALIQLQEGVNGFSFSQMNSEDYSDLRFTKDDGVTELAFEVEEWNSTAPIAANPTNVAGCQVWFKADAGVLTNASGRVTSWLDQSGRGRHATNNTADQQPALRQNALNSLPAIRFDGMDDRLNFNATFLANTGYTIFLVEGRLSSKASNWIIRGTDADGEASRNKNLHVGYRDNITFAHAQYSNDYNMDVPGYSSQQFEVYTLDCGDSKHTWLNGTLLGSAADSSKLLSYNGASVGGNGAYQGEIAELIIYNRILSKREMAGVHLYLKHKYALEIVVDDAQTISALVWVQVPELTHNSAIHAYWGNPVATVIPDYTTNGAVWAAEFGGVWHMNERDVIDTTVNQNHGLSSNSPAVVPANIGAGVAVEASARQDIRVDQGDSIKATGNFTASIWFRSSWEGKWFRNLMGNFGAGGNGGSGTFWGLGWMEKNDIGFAVRVDNQNTYLKGGAFNDGQWHHLVGQKEGDLVRLYIDGQLMDSGTRPGTPVNGEQLRFGSHQEEYITATVNEARFENLVRSADWIKAVYDNQINPAAFSFVDSTYYYDTGADAGLQSGDAIWSTAAAAWNTAADGTDTLRVWQNDAHALFGANGTSVVSVDTVRANKITIHGSGYSIQDGAITLGRGGIKAYESVGISSALSLSEPQGWSAADGKTLTISGAVANNSFPLTITGTGDTTLDGVISGSGAVLKEGPGTLTLSGVNTYAGATMVTHGLMRLSQGGGAGAIRGTLTVESAGQVDLLVANALGYTAGQRLNTLNINGALVNNVASGDNGRGLTINLTGGELRSNGGVASDITGQLYSLGGGSAVNVLASAATATISGRLVLHDGNPSGQLPFNVAAGSAGVDLRVSASITEANGSHGIAKRGNGVMELVAANIYSGPTLIEDGTLLVNNTAGSATGSGAVEINGGVLGGTGTVSGAVSCLNNGGFVFPGNDSGEAGTLTVGGLTFTAAAPSGLYIEIADAASHDSLVVNGPVTLTGALLSGQVTGAVNPGDLLFIIINNSGTPVSGTFAGLPQGGTVAFGEHAFTISYTGDAATQATVGGHDVVLYNASSNVEALPTGREFSFPGYTRTTTLTNFPVLVALQEGLAEFSFANFLSPYGDDLRFYTDQSQSVELNYEIDLWDTNGISYVWVQIPEFTRASSIWASWGNPAAAAKPSYTTSGAVWSANYGAVWHMNQADLIDSSPNKNHGVAYNAPAVSTARVGRGVTLDSGSKQHIRVNNHSTIDPPDNFTASIWCNTTYSGGWYRNIMGNFGSSGGINPKQTFWGLGWMHSGAIGFVARVSNNSTDVNGTTDRYDDGGWHLLTGQKEGATMRFYVDGNLVATGTRAGNVSNWEQIWFGWHGNTTSQHISGTLDEARIANAVRSPDWIWACYANQVDPMAFTGESASGRYWDTTPSIGIQGGDGVWDIDSTALWSDNKIFGSVPLQHWRSALNDAYFTRGASAVTVSNAAANRAVFEAAGCSLTGGDLQLARGLHADESLSVGSKLLLSDDQSWHVAAGKTVTLNTGFDGRVRLTKSGEGDLYLNRRGSKYFKANAIIIDQGRVRFNTGGYSEDPFQDWPITITINQGATARTETTHAFGNQKHWVKIVGGALELNNEQYLRDGSEMFGGEIKGSGQLRLSGNITLYVRTSGETAVISAPVASYNSDNNLLVEDGPSAVDLLVSGRMMDRGFRKRGAGTAEFTNSNNSYTNTTAIEGGTLLVNNAAGTGTGVSAIYINGGTLGGTGSVANAVSFGPAGGAIAPGSKTGTLTANCDVNFTTAGAKRFNVVVDSSAEGGYSQLAVNGAVTLDNATLSVQLNSEVRLSDRLFIIVNHGANPIVGTFAGLPNAGSISVPMGARNQSFQVYYTADAVTGTIMGGNDVALVPIAVGTQIILR